MEEFLPSERMRLAMVLAYPDYTSLPTGRIVGRRGLCISAQTTEHRPGNVGRCVLESWEGGIRYTSSMQPSVNKMHPLYRRTLGDAFDSLPPVLRRFHEQSPEAGAQGTLHITRGSGRIRQALAALMRLPLPGEQVPVVLQVQTVGEAEHWRRDFGTLRLVTQQWLQDGLLIETAGPLRFGFRLTADAKEMRFEFARCWFVGMPLPTALAPRVNATASEYEDGWWLRVRIDVPLLGMLTQYEGKVTPQC